MKPVFHMLARSAPLLLVLPLAAGLGGCTMASNRSLTSVHQPVVSHTALALDLATTPDGLPAYEQKRLADWFDALALHYGDQVTIDDPAQNPRTRAAVRALVAAHGLVLGSQPVNAAAGAPGLLRVNVVRAVANVPGCPDWSSNVEANLRNATSTNYGCATNSNLAAMIANPDDLLHGATDTGNTRTATSDKAIASYRAAKPTGEGGLKKTSGN
ncbi:MAG TPA: CpaD family pilus assembly lipoprotein [Novosphingobium sp.]|nr:CpaD family pilus assembly lipoprotein [Novosphingobium sp.]